MGIPSGVHAYYVYIRVHVVHVVSVCVFAYFLHVQYSLHCTLFERSALALPSLPPSLPPFPSLSLWPQMASEEVFSGTVEEELPADSGSCNVSSRNRPNVLKIQR